LVVLAYLAKKTKLENSFLKRESFFGNDRDEQTIFCGYQGAVHFRIFSQGLLEKFINKGAGFT